MKTMKIDWAILVNNPTRVMALSRGGRLVTRVEVLIASSAMNPEKVRVTFADGHKSVLTVQSWGWASESGYKNDVISMMVAEGAELKEHWPKPEINVKNVKSKPSPMILTRH